MTPEPRRSRRPPRGPPARPATGPIGAATSGGPTLRRPIGPAGPPPLGWVRAGRGTGIMIEVWGRRSSSNVQVVMWCLAELGLEPVRHDAGGRHGVTDTAAFAAMNPNRTVPVLRDGAGPFLWESGAILRYLATRHASGPFWPADPLERAHVDRWAEWAKINVALAFTRPVFWRVVRTAPAERDPDAIRGAVAALEAALAIAEDRLAEHPWLAGPDFTLADVQLGHVLHRYLDIEIGRRPLPRIGAYYRRLTERPAYREHVMVSYEDLRAAGA